MWLYVAKKQEALKGKGVSLKKRNVLTGRAMSSKTLFYLYEKF